MGTREPEMALQLHVRAIRAMSSSANERRFRELHFANSLPTVPVFKISMAKLVRVSPYFRRMLDEESRKPENEGTTVNMNILPGVLRIMLSYVETRELLDAHILEDYKNWPVEEDVSLWMIMSRVYQAANRFEMLELKNTVMYKIVEMCFAMGTVPCGTLETIYRYTKAGAGVRRFMIDLTAHEVSPTEYRTHFLSWTLDILHDLLIAVKDTRGEEPYATGIEKYLSAI